MMSKRLTNLLFAVLNGVIMAYGQLVPIQNVQSPEIANLGLYGKIPVSLFTGIPDISIPLYELKAGDFTLPISISYHLASVQPNRQYGVLGMGWNLIAGGYISRVANFIYDEKQNKNGDKYGYYYHCDKMQAVSVDSTKFDNLVRNSITGNNTYDLCADEFYFDFLGYSGRFYLCPDGSWKVVSEDDIKLEFDPNNDGLIRSSRLEDEKYYYQGKIFTRMNINMWERKNENGWYFNKFTLITPDGSRYEFGGLYATEYSISYYNPNNNDLIPTTWRLAKITTPDKRVIQFNYKKDFIEGIPLLCDIRYTPTKSYGTYVSSIQRGWDGMTGYIIFPSVLESIVAEDERISFHVAKDPRYIHMFDRSQIFYRQVNHNVFSPYELNAYNSDNQYNAFFHISPNNTQKSIGEQIRAQLSSYYLKGMTIDTGFGEDSVLVNFSYLDRKRKMLKKVTISGKSFDESYTSQSFSFGYNEPEKMPDNFVFPETDSWGYYRGDTISLSDIPQYTLQAPSSFFTKAGILNSITYPTGGKAVLDYELNDYSKSISLYDRQQLTQNQGIAGGLRVSKIQLLDSDGSILNTKKYFYTTKKSESKSSGILSDVPCFEITYHFGDKFLRVNSEGGFWPSSLGSNTPVVGYSTVFEEIFDKNNQSSGYTKYCFSNFDNDIYGERHLDENSSHATSAGSGLNYYYTSRSVERGKLLSKQYYDSSGNLQKTINYRYRGTSQENILSASQFIVNIAPSFGDYYALGWLNKVYAYSYLKQQEADTTFVRSIGACYYTRKEYAYNSCNLLKTISELCSDGSTMTTSYLYAVDMPEYSWLVDKHFVSPLIEKKDSYRGKVKTIKYDYSITSDTGVPYIRKITSSYNDSDFKNDYEVILADKYGNPIEIVVDGMKSLLYWGSNGQLLHGRIDNFSNMQAVALGMMDAVDYSNHDNYWMEAFYRKFFKLPTSAQMHVYNYERRRLLESIIDPSGFTTFYKFDGLNRLREVYHYDYKSNSFKKHLMHVYDYHCIDNHPTED